MNDLGGKTLGWHKDDHNEYVKLSVKHKNDFLNDDFIDECVNCLGLFSK